MNSQADANADQHLLFAILMLAEGSHQVVPTWNHKSQLLMPSVPCGRVHAAVCNIATLTTTSERKPKTKELITPIVLKKLRVEERFHLQFSTTNDP